MLCNRPVSSLVRAQEFEHWWAGWSSQRGPIVLQFSRNRGTDLELKLTSDACYIFNVNYSQLRLRALRGTFRTLSHLFSLETLISDIQYKNMKINLLSIYLDKKNKESKQHLYWTLVLWFCAKLSETCFRETSP